jgi:hypothetical protein
MPKSIEQELISSANDYGLSFTQIAELFDNRENGLYLDINNNEYTDDFNQVQESISRFAKPPGRSVEDSSDHGHYDEGEDRISSKDKVLTQRQVAVILTKQYHNAKHRFSPNRMANRWLTSEEYTLVKAVPLWVMRPFKYHPPSDRSYSVGPIILDYFGEYPETWGSFGSKDIFRIVDGKHRYWDSLRDGKKTFNCFVGDAIHDELLEYIQEFGPKRDRFLKALKKFYENPEGDDAVVEMWIAGEKCGLDLNQLNDIINQYKYIGIKLNPEMGEFQTEEEEKEEGLKPSRFSKSGDAGDCGHDSDGSFSQDNTCASSKSNQSSQSPSQKRQRAESWSDPNYPEKYWTAVLKIHERLPDSIHGREVPSMTLKGIKKMHYNILKTLYKPNDRQWGGVTITSLADHVLGPQDDRANDIFDNLMTKYAYNSYQKDEWKNELESEDRRQELHAVARAKAFSKTIDDLVASGRLMATVKDEGDFEPVIYIRPPNDTDTKVSGARYNIYKNSLNSFAESLGKSKFAHAGDVDDCGHDNDGRFSDGNTCGNINNKDNDDISEKDYNLRLPEREWSEKARDRLYELGIESGDVFYSEQDENVGKISHVYANLDDEGLGKWYLETSEVNGIESISPWTKESQRFYDETKKEMKKRKKRK